MIQRITIHIYDKLRALYMADYLSTYGIEVKEVVILINSRCIIIMTGDEEDVMNLVQQFHEDY